MSIKTKIRSLIAAANAKTGKSDTDLTTAVQSLISESDDGTLRRKEYTGEIVSTIKGTNAYAVLAQDDLLAEHRNTESLFVRVEFDIGPTPYTVVKTWAANAVDTIIIDSSQNQQLVHRWDSSGKKSIGYPTALITNNAPVGVGCILITEAGELRCYSLSSNYAIRPSKYKVIIEW